MIVVCNIYLGFKPETVERRHWNSLIVADGSARSGVMITERSIGREVG